ncbi:MAG: 3-phosphoserine/phosphohydroxythreonine transaminase [Deltaproteobacteria bacterium]|nr:3-phosphoserine/phosphohydroxythreonine transaminase [Deltaproteobacteria bacterium]
MTERIVNFSAGPAVLPESALKQAQRDLFALPGVGMSVLEISHRSKTFTAIIEEAEANLRALLQIPDSYHILFLQGGATLQFSMVPMNFLRGAARPATYIQSGSWGTKAVKEAKREGDVVLAWDGKAQGFVRIPRSEELTIPHGTPYVHFTSNETIEGVEFDTEPAVGNVPLVCDASSDFMSRPLPVEEYALLYAGAQKNIGPAGATVVIARDEFLKQGAANLHTMLDYRVMAAQKSLYNTPPVFGIYMIMLVTRWLRDEIGGLENIEAQNRRKAALLYDVIDGSHGFYRGHADRESRSVMNVTWRLGDEALETAFLEEASRRKLSGLKGHRSVGGCRASIYNAMPVAGVETLAGYMTAFQQQHG